MINKLNRFLTLTRSGKLYFLYRLYFKMKTQIFYKILFKKIGSNSIVINPLLLTHECLTIGKNVIIMDCARIEGISHYANKKFTPNIILEDEVTIQQRCHITAADTLIIGKNSLISFDVSIQDTDHEYIDINTPINMQPLILKKTQIGENCFIGSGVKILAGTILGKHCIVGANSVVRGIFPSNCVIVGIPAKIVKRYNNLTGKWEPTNKIGEFLN